MSVTKGVRLQRGTFFHCDLYCLIEIYVDPGFLIKSVVAPTLPISTNRP